MYSSQTEQEQRFIVFQENLAIAEKQNAAERAAGGRYARKQPQP